MHYRQAVAQPLFGTQYSNIREPLRIIIRDQQTWTEFWGRMGGTSLPASPSIDFSKDVVVVAAMGERQRAGYSIDIAGVSQDAPGVLHVDVASTIPAAACAGADVITTPLAAVVVPKTSDTVRFSERTVVLSCD